MAAPQESTGPGAELWTETDFLQFRKYVVVRLVIWIVVAVLVALAFVFATVEGGLWFIALGLIVLFPGVANIRLAMSDYPEAMRRINEVPTPRSNWGHGLSLFTTVLLVLFFGLPGLFLIVMFGTHWIFLLGAAGFLMLSVAFIVGYVVRRRENAAGNAIRQKRNPGEA
jgi:hypothetical protein